MTAKKDKKDKVIVKGLPATPKWWARLEEAQKEAGFDNRSNFIRLLVTQQLDRMSFKGTVK